MLAIVTAFISAIMEGQYQVKQVQNGNVICKEFYKFITNILHHNHALLQNSMGHFCEMIHVIKREII